MIGHGGVSAVAEATGLARRTIYRGLEDLEDRALAGNDRVRRRGGGRKSKITEDPTLLSALKSPLEPVTRGDPMRHAIVDVAQPAEATLSSARCTLKSGKCSAKTGRIIPSSGQSACVLTSAFGSPDGGPTMKQSFSGSCAIVQKLKCSKVKRANGSVFKIFRFSKMKSSSFQDVPVPQ